LKIDTEDIFFIFSLIGIVLFIYIVVAFIYEYTTNVRPALDKGYTVVDVCLLGWRNKEADEILYKVPKTELAFGIWNISSDYSNVPFSPPAWTEYIPMVIE